MQRKGQFQEIYDSTSDVPLAIFTMSRLDHIREKQKLRRELLAKQLGVDSGDKLHTVLNSSKEQKEKVVDKKSQDSISSKAALEPPTKIFKGKEENNALSEASRDNNAEREPEQCDKELEVYKGSSTFLKGTQSLNPHNDYCQNFVDTNQRPQNYIRDVGLADRFEEYPKLKDLNYLKDELIRKTNTPPMYLQCDLENFDLRDLGSKFEVVLIQPPLEEYRRHAGIPSEGRTYFSWEDIMALEIEEIAAPRSFVFLWCGSTDGLDHGRQCLKKWGFRRCEDICWIKTNFKKQPQKTLGEESLFVCTKEHCLMGIKGTVRRSTDGDFIHANVDIDLIIDEEEELGSEEKPEEIFHLIEHFCLSRRRLHLFGGDSSIRPGWLTVGPRLTKSNFDAETYKNYFKATEEHPNGYLTGCTEEIERLRPKTPPPRGEKMVERGSHHGPPARGSRGGPSGGGIRRGDMHGSRMGHSDVTNHIPGNFLPPNVRNSGVGGLPNTPLSTNTSYHEGPGGRHPYIPGKPNKRGRGGFREGEWRVGERRDIPPRNSRNSRMPGRGGFNGR